MSDRLERARAWHRSQGAGAPELVDVEFAARLGVGSADVVRRMLWQDAAALLAHWDGLAAALEEAPASAPAAPAAPSPMPSPMPPPMPPPFAPEPAGDPVVEARYRVLRDFVAERSAAGEDVTGVEDEKLREIAALERPDLRRFHHFLRGHADEITARLAEVGTPAPAGPPAPTSDGGAAPPGSSGRSGGQPSGPAEPTDFRPWEYPQGAPEDAPPPPRPAGLEFSVAETGEVTISWPQPPADGQVRVFRVVAEDRFMPDFSPDAGQLVAATYDCTVTDTRPATAPVRRVAVWMHVGPTERAARDSLPRVYAAGSCVLPVRNCVIREDEGTVIGQWRAAQGISRVDVLRIPADVAATQQHYNLNYRLPPEIVGLGGFEDSAAEPGQAYEYRVYAFADVDEIATPSPYVAGRVRIKAVLQKIEDLRVTPQEGAADLYDLTWTKPPLGKVEIYRSETPPASGIDAKVIDRSVLVRQGLTPELQLTRQLDYSDGVESMRNVPWPEGWTRAYFTAVTVLAEDRIQVGNIVILNRTHAVEGVRLLERVDEQLLTFAWPPGAGQVRVYVGPRGAPLVNPEAQVPIAEIFEDAYNKQGGVHLPDPLPSGQEGCTVHVVAVSFAQGRVQVSPPQSVDYPGLARIRYWRAAPEQQRGFLPKSGGAPNRHQVVAEADSVINEINLVLLHQHHRLPLHSKDGREIGRRSVSLAPGAPVVVVDDLDLASMPGFIRLFADVPDEIAHVVAVLDPPVAQLRGGPS